MPDYSELLQNFKDIASNPGARKQKYINEGKKIILTAPVYTPEEIIHSMGLVPMGAWGADCGIENAKQYFPAFICSIMQTILELGIKGTYDGCSAIVIPSLCDSLKVIGQNWKYAVKGIPFIPMTYPQNRKGPVGEAFTKAGYERVINDLENITGCSFSQEALNHSIDIYNEHNAVMRRFSELAAVSEITAEERNAVFKSAFFMLKEEHTALVKQLLEVMPEEKESKTKIAISGILADSPSFLKCIDESGLKIAFDDVAAQSRQYRTDAASTGTAAEMSDGKNDNDLSALDRLVKKFSAMDNCSVLYDPDKKRAKLIADTAVKAGVKGVIIALTKFCDPEEFDAVIIKKACEAVNIKVLVVETDRQMDNYGQARTAIETFAEMLTL